MEITGTFEVKLKPLDSYADGQHGVTLARMSIDKSFYGELEASSKGEMAIRIEDGQHYYEFKFELP
jgi:hypothetical protein